MTLIMGFYQISTSVFSHNFYLFVAWAFYWVNFSMGLTLVRHVAGCETYAIVITQLLLQCFLLPFRQVSLLDPSLKLNVPPMVGSGCTIVTTGTGPLPFITESLFGTLFCFAYVYTAHLTSLPL
jgi:hypothetical protein